MVVSSQLCWLLVMSPLSAASLPSCVLVAGTTHGTLPPVVKINCGESSACASKEAVELTLSTSVFVSVPSALVAAMVMLKVPVTVGMPLMAPLVVFTAMPAGMPLAA